MLLDIAWKANKFCIGLLHSCSTDPARIIGVRIAELQLGWPNLG